MTQWIPASPCGPECLPPRDKRAEVGLPRVVLRLGRTAGLLLVGCVLVLALSPLRTAWRDRALAVWFRMLLRALGIGLLLGERIPPGGALVVSNHVSWLDIVALQALCPMRMLAKVEVRSWPVLGALAGRVGTVYIERDRLSVLPDAVRTIAEELRAGAVIGAFPEGTTWCGRASGRFRPAVFQAAIDAGARMQPVALRFRTAAGLPTTAAAFLGDATLVDSVLAVARMRDLVVELVVLPELVGTDRRELARRAQHAISATTGSVLGHESLPQQRAAPGIAA
ncbi:lysophospholipid acyltransferase family protein [Saccharopolyspora phatthalungensis]|uniref:1-acyl-sn-glycerol-3-phosphate acyltransferase n=1 Tax=Saccharopolyspora phatthalungensis TaxID=664693 RepID=A0A840Q675_9PSEU|nr:lysophospholipid acyltransferase family protein [Saccharopolyspora phatthalungensis]MBB5155380.1 1-acyl-sn-glycerol-3-phosphate acyltransferase [Saccharopolyspora phatthalungensis]